MKIKIVDHGDPDAAVLAVYDGEHVPAVGDFVKFPGEQTPQRVETRIWQPPFDEVIVSVRNRRSWWSR